MKAKEVLIWLRGQIPEARLKFKGLRFQPKGHIKMDISQVTRAQAWPEANLIRWGKT